LGIGPHSSFMLKLFITLRRGRHLRKLRVNAASATLSANYVLAQVQSIYTDQEIISVRVPTSLQCHALVTDHRLHHLLPLATGTLLLSPSTSAKLLTAACGFAHPVLDRRTIKRTHKSARLTCAERYGELRRHYTNEHQSLQTWRSYWRLAGRRTKRHNLTSIIKKRTAY